MSPSFAGLERGILPVVVQTDAGGRFHVPDPPRGLVTVEVRAGGLRAIRVGVPFRADLAGLDIGALRVEPPGSLSGQLRGPANLGLLGADIEVLGTPYAAKADESGRFSIPSVAPGSYRIKASRPRFVAPLSADVEVRPGMSAVVPDLVLVPDAPVLSALSQANGAAGAEIALSGRNFGVEPDVPFEILFGNLQAAAMRRESDTVAMVVVPEGAMSGPVSVVRDGVPSDPLPFQVIATLSLDPGYAGHRPGDQAALQVLASDTDGLPVAAPSVTWSARDRSGNRAVSLPESGKAAPPGNGFFEYGIRSGSLSAKATVAVGTGTVSTLLGGPEALDRGDGGPAADARVVRPLGLAAGGDGTLYFTDFVSGKIRAIKPDGLVLSIRSGLNGPRGVAVLPDGTLFFTERIGGGQFQRVVRLAGDTATEVATGSFYGLASGPGGVVAAAGGDRVFRVDNLSKPGDPAEVLADGLVSAICVAFDPDGNLYVGETGRVWKYSGGTRKAIAGGGSDPAPEAPALQVAARTITGVAYHLGSVFYVDGSRHLLREATSDGRVRTVAGDGFVVPGGTVGRFNGDGLALATSFNSPTALAVHPNGGLVVAEGGVSRLRLWRP